jgi:hypothetical protein
MTNFVETLAFHLMINTEREIEREREFLNLKPNNLSKSKMIFAFPSENFFSLVPRDIRRGFLSELR